VERMLQSDRIGLRPPSHRHCGTHRPAMSLWVRARKALRRQSTHWLRDHRTEEPMPTEPTIARIWRGRTRPEIADDYEAYLKTDGIPPLEKTALGVQLFREDREHESWFTTISYWPDREAMTAFTK